MTNTYTWKIVNLQRTLPEGKVYTVDYIVSAVSDKVNPASEDNGFYSADIFGTIGLDGEMTIDFSSLTEEVVVNWVKEALGGNEKVAEIEADLDAQIEQKINPSTAIGKPW